MAFPRALVPLRDAWRTRAREHGDELYFALWFFVILVFFSLSHSKLLPYILPAFPAAAALTAYGILSNEARWKRGLLAYALLYGFVAPFWLIRATADVVTGTKRSWR